MTLTFKTLDHIGPITTREDWDLLHRHLKIKEKHFDRGMPYIWMEYKNFWTTTSNFWTTTSINTGNYRTYTLGEIREHFTPNHAHPRQDAYSLWMSGRYQAHHLPIPFIPTPSLHSLKEETKLSYKQQAKKTAQDLCEVIKPYQTYILAGAALFVLDYFILGGRGAEKLKATATRLYNKLESIVDAGLDKALGSEDTDETQESSTK